MSVRTENIRYVCWQNQPNPAMWPNLLVRWLGLSESVAEAVLEGRRQLTADELSALSGQVGFSEEELQFHRLIDEISILTLNLNYLFSQSPRGFKSDVARELGINKNTISRWCTGTQAPSAVRLDQLRRLFGLTEQVNLLDTPLFLSRTPEGTHQRKVWLKDRIDKLDSDNLKLMFPALERLLKE